MDFKRFLDININEDNKFIIFKNNKILYEPELKTFLLDGAYLDLNLDELELYWHSCIDNNKIYALDITNYNQEINVRI